MYTDAHIHLKDYADISGIEPQMGQTKVCASSHNKDEFLYQEQFSFKYTDQVLVTFGIHPQSIRTAHNSELAFLEELILAKRIAAIGEIGFDLYSSEFSVHEKAQKELWNIQLELAIAAELPVVIHCRKALHHFFADSKRLSLLPAVIFHGWPGSAVEAQSFLSRGLHAYFCAGKALLRGDRSLRETISAIPLSRILTETDAPYMTLKGESYSSPSDIAAVSSAAASLKNLSLEDFCHSVKENFNRAFNVR